MKSVFVVLLGLFMLPLFIQCNDGKDETNQLACSQLSVSSLTLPQQATLQNAGFDVGSTIQYNLLDSTQKVVFNTAGLDSTECYNVTE